MSTGAGYALGVGMFAVAVAGLLSGAAQVHEGNEVRHLRTQVQAMTHVTYELEAAVRACKAQAQADAR